MEVGRRGSSCGSVGRPKEKDEEGQRAKGVRAEKRRVPYDDEQEAQLTGARSKPHSKIISSCSSAQLLGSSRLNIFPPLSSLKMLSFSVQSPPLDEES